MNKHTILIIDDEPQIRKLLLITLEANAYRVIQAETAQLGISLIANHNPDLVLLDIELPDKNGQEILKEVRQWYNNAIIMLSVLNGEEEIVKALDNGATDYLSKPFRTAELLARIRNAIKRNHDTTNDTIFVFEDLEIDVVARVVKRNNEILKLTSTEYNLLLLFATNHGRVLTQQYILKQIWGIGSQTEAQYLRVFVGTLRKKIEDNPLKPVHIITESRIGYRFQ
jgi:two-component system KDP operon response regulator KdpE